MPKRGMSAVIVTLLLVMLSIVLIGIVYAVIHGIISSGTQQTTFQFGNLVLGLNLGKISINTTGDSASIQVTRAANTGTQNLTGIAFVISDGANSVVIKKKADLQELETHTFYFNSSSLQSLAYIKDVSIAPIVSSNGKEQVGSQSATTTYTTDLGTRSNPAISCLDLRLKDTSGIYWIDPDGTGPVQVYCDMTTDGGGWTLIAVCKPNDNPNYPTYDASVPSSQCWNSSAVGTVTNPNSTTTVKLSDSEIRAVLIHGKNITRGHWTQTYRYNANSPVNVYIYNKFINPNQWSSGGVSSGQFYVKYNYDDSWGSLLSNYGTGCSSGDGGWSNQNYNGHGESCGSYGAWLAWCESAPSSSHCCACQAYDERANVTVYAK